MKNILTILIIFLLMTPITASAAVNRELENKGKNVNEHQEAKKPKNEQDVQTITLVPSNIPPHAISSFTPLRIFKTEKVKDKNSQSQQITVSQSCDPNAEWKNHGAYVSCVAHQKLGGQSTAAAARSSVGKKPQTITPTASPSATPTITPSQEPSPPATPSVSPISSESSSLVKLQSAFDGSIIHSIKELIQLLRNYMHSILPLRSNTIDTL